MEGKKGKRNQRERQYIAYNRESTKTRNIHLSSGVRVRYSLSISPSILFLIICGLGRNRARSCSVTWKQIIKKKTHSIVYLPFHLFFC